jgi:hypothetical protein
MAPRWPKTSDLDEPWPGQGTITEDGCRIGYPATDVREILAKLNHVQLVRIGREHTLDGSHLLLLDSADQATLNRFASEVAGVEGCTVRAIYGCGSCHLGCRWVGPPGDRDRICFRGNRVVTDCGQQCWYCGIDS